MAISNALLIRAAYGWDEATRPSSISTHGRREALYGLGAYNSATDVARVASARLDIIAEPRYQFDAEHKPPTDAELAYHGYAVGDTVLVTSPGGGPTSERVLSLAVSEDNDTGMATVTSTLHDVVMYASPLENFVAMLSQAVKKMIPGTGRGDWKEAQPVTPPALPAPIRGGLSAGPFILTTTWQGASVGAPSIDFTINAPDVDDAWLLMTFDAGGTVELASAGWAPIPAGTASYDTRPFTLGEAGKSARQVIVVLFRYGATGAVGLPTLTHPDVSSFNFQSDAAGVALEFWTSEAGITEAGTYAPLTIAFNETSTTAIGWMVFTVDDAVWNNYNFAASTGDGTIDGAGADGETVIAALVTYPGFAPSFSAPWGQHTAATGGTTVPG